VRFDFDNEDRVAQSLVRQTIPVFPVFPLLPAGIPVTVQQIRADSAKSGTLLILVTMLFADYITLVLADYQQKKLAGLLPLELIEPSPARLRDGCLAVYNERYERKDERALERFFGKAADSKSRLQSIARCDIDKFRPLVNYLKDPTINTDPKNIELLAWLIDYKERPHGSKPPFDPEPDPKEPVSTGKNEDGPGVASKDRRVKKLTIIITITIALASIIVYRFLQQPARTFPSIPPGTQACMFWADDHYQPVSCNQKLGDTVVIALDSEKLAHFRKIDRPDTITEAAKGHVWYCRYRGSYEFYTDSGYHPLDPNLRLRPITSYIITRHVPVNK